MMWRHGRPNIEKLKARADVDALIQAMDYTSRRVSDVHAVRLAAIAALGDLKDVRALVPLVMAAWRAIPIEVAETAIRALRAIDPQWEESQAVRRAMEDAIDHALDSSHPAPGRVAHNLRHKFRHPHAVELVAARLWQGGRGLAAVEALTLLEDPRAVEFLVERLRTGPKDNDLSGERRIKPLIIATLVSISEPRAIEGVKERVRSNEGWERATAARALARIGDVTGVVDALVDALTAHALRGKDEASAAIEALRTTRDPRAVEGLTHAALTVMFDDLRNQARDAVIEMADTRAVELLVAVLAKNPVSQDDLDRAMWILGGMLEKSASRLTPDALRVIMGLEDGTRLVQDSYIDHQDWGRSKETSTTTTISFAALRDLAQIESGRRPSSRS